MTQLLMSTASLQAIFLLTVWEGAAVWHFFAPALSGLFLIWFGRVLLTSMWSHFTDYSQSINLDWTWSHFPFIGYDLTKVLPLSLYLRKTFILITSVLTFPWQLSKVTILLTVCNWKVTQNGVVFRDVPVTWFWRSADTDSRSDPSALYYGEKKSSPNCQFFIWTTLSQHNIFNI